MSYKHNSLDEIKSQLRKLAEVPGGSFSFEEDELVPLFRVDQSNQPESNNNFYNSRVEAYDANLHITFDTHGLVERDVRKDLINSIDPLGRDVLEVGSGTGRDSEIILEEFPTTKLIMLEPADRMMDACVIKLRKKGLKALGLLAKVEEIPLPNDSVDAVYSFGGFNEFEDKKKALAEIERVSRSGAKVLIADEGIPWWWRETDFFHVLSHTNPQFKSFPPLEDLPASCKNTVLRWVIGETFWVITYEVSKTPPSANFDITIPGRRGGTLATRYYGKTEGISRELRKRLDDHLAESNISEHEFLEEAVGLHLSTEDD